MKKFTLLLALLLAVVGVKASRTWYNNPSGTTGEINMPKDNYLVAGDVISITFSEATGSSISFYYNETYDYTLETAKFKWVSSGGTYEYVVNTVDVDLFKTKNVKFKHDPGENPASTVTNITVRHSNAIGSTTIYDTEIDLTSWGSSPDIASTLFTGIKLNDIIRINLSSVSEGAQIRLGYKGPAPSYTWHDDMGTTATQLANMSIGMTHYDYIVDETILNIIKNDSYCVRVDGKLFKASSIVLLHSLSITDAANPACEAATFTKVYLTRSLIAGYNTLCLPFAATKAELGLEEDDVIYELGEGSTASSIKLSTVSSIVANKPYLVYCAAARTLTSSFNNLTVSASDASSTPQGDWTMYGNYTPALSMNGKYIVYGDKIQLCGSGPYVNGLRAYFEYKGVEARESVTFDFGGETTGVNEVSSRISDTKADYFNLAGQRIAQPTKGLYIVNGKKVVIK